jgi:hypothetical protein
MRTDGIQAIGLKQNPGFYLRSSDFICGYFSSPRLCVSSEAGG